MVVEAHGIESKNKWEKLSKLEIGERIETIQTTELLKSYRILRSDLENRRDLLSSSFEWLAIG